MGLKPGLKPRTARLQARVGPRTSTRALSTTPPTLQARHKLKPTPRPPPITRASFEPDNPYLPASAILPDGPPDSIQFPILVPAAALDSNITRKLQHASLKAAENQISDPLIAQQVRQDGQVQLHQILDDWIRNELNVLGTIREETIQIFHKLLLHPSTLAPIAHQLRLQTAGRNKLARPSGHIAKKLSRPRAEVDEELQQLLHYFIGSIYRTLQPPLDAHSQGKLQKYVVEMVKLGVPLARLQKMLWRASNISGQSAIGDAKGHARAEIRVAQLQIWGLRRDTKLRKLVPDQIAHRTRERSRKARVLKERWLAEEVKLVHWRRRLLKINAVEANERAAAAARRAEHAAKMAEWRAAEVGRPAPAAAAAPGLLAKMFNFWPFASATASDAHKHV